MTSEEIHNLFFKSDGTRRNSEEREKLLRAREEGRTQGAIAVNRAKRETAALIEETTPAHLRRPMNRFTKLADLLDSGDRFQTDETKRHVAMYRELAIQEDERIDQEMHAKKRQHEIDTDPIVRDAREHCDKAEQFATEEEKAGWQAARGFLDAGSVQQYWQEAVRLTTTARERVEARLSNTGAALDHASMEHGKTLDELQQVKTVIPEQQP